jgi:hypothetical protein
MADFTLLESKKLEIYKLILKHKCDYKIFDWTVTQDLKGNEISILRIPEMHFYFGFDYIELQGYLFECSPGEHVKTEAGKTISWENTKDRVETWIANCKREMKVPDLFEELISGSESKDFENVDLKNESFSKEEIEKISNKLDKLYVELEKQKNVEQEIKNYTKLEFDYLKKCSETMGKKDWFNITFTVLMTVISKYGLPLDEAKYLFSGFWDGFKTIFQLPY